MARLLLHFREHPLRLIPLAGNPLRIGRQADCEVAIDSLAVEPLHARLEPSGKGWKIRPESEHTPVFVNGERIPGARRLQEGDVIRIGKHSLHYSEESATEEAPVGRQRATVTRLPLHPRKEGFLQFLNGRHVGRTIRLDRAMMRLGKRGEVTAMIARRRDGYYLSLLEGTPAPEHNGRPIGEHAVRLRNGDEIRLGSLVLQFFQEADGSGPASSWRGEERRFTRVPFPVAARLHAAGMTQPCQVLDLSLKGALVELPEEAAIDPARVQLLEIPLEEELAIRMEVEVVRTEDRQLGLLCRDIDVESVSHLRRLVELNSGDPALLERELAELG